MKTFMLCPCQLSLWGGGGAGEVLLHNSLHRCGGWSVGWLITQNGHGNLHHPEGMESLIVYYRVKVSAPLGNLKNLRYQLFNCL